MLAGALANGSQPYPLETRVIQERSDDKSDFWTSIGGQYKASLDYGVLVSCDAGTVVERGPEVRTQTVRVRDRFGPRSRMEEFHRIGGIVRDGDGQPVANAWVALPELGLWSASGTNGRFRFDRIQPGKYRCVVPRPTVAEASGDVEVPGRGIELDPRRGQGREGAPPLLRGSRRCPNGCPVALCGRVRAQRRRVVVWLPAPGRPACSSPTSSR